MLLLKLILLSLVTLTLGKKEPLSRKSASTAFLFSSARRAG